MNHIDYTIPNVKNIREEILRKNSSFKPYKVDHTIYGVNTDYDEFPYPRWFKGHVKSDYPVITEREAGWVPKRTMKAKLPKEEIKPLNTCFQNACSIVYPCYAPESNYISSNKVCNF